MQIKNIKYNKEYGKIYITTFSKIAHTTPEKIKNQLTIIKTNAQGLLNINLKMIKLISEPLSEIINVLLKTGNILQIRK